jgi:hypothetical protein
VQQVKALVDLIEPQAAGQQLVYTQTIAELHSGTISAGSARPGAGSEFVLRLPIIVARENISSSE